MSRRHFLAAWVSLSLGLALALALSASLASAQDRLKRMPGYEQYQKQAGQINGSVKFGALSVTWRDDGKAFDFEKDGKHYRYDIASRETKELSEEELREGSNQPPRRNGRFANGFPGRGRQFASTNSPDGTLKAFHRDRNLWLSDPNGVVEMAITTDGTDANRVKYGTASWVYGEELYQNTAMWWSPDGKKLAFYRFDESQVNDYYLQLEQTNVQDALDVEAYPKSGTPNPIVDLLVYDLPSKKTVTIDVRDGKPFADDAVGYYVYGISWTSDGKGLLFHRTNRLQNILELAVADPDSGKCRAVVHEEWPESWVENSPPMRFLEDGKRFLWTSERNGWKNLYLYNLDGELLATVTNHEFEVEDIVRVDEKAGLVDYMARDGDNPMKLQLHRAKLDGSEDRRLTDPAFDHRVDIAPDGAHFVDVYQTHDTPPATRLVSAEGEVIEELAESDMTKFDELGLKRVEMLTFKAADGTTDLYGMLHFPSNFDPKQTYPLLVSVYAGPATNAARESFALPSRLTEYGFLVASFDSRSAAGRGKRFLDAIYRKLGTVEMDDQAEGVKSLWDRPYLRKNRVGIFGTSYGGTASIMCLLRHPEVYHAACASSPVTDWRNYDTIYTERYMATPELNPDGYKAGSAMTYAKDLDGRLMIFYGTADDNVHPSNTLQFVRALQTAGKSFELQVGPDMGHSAVNLERMMEFFIENLVLPDPVETPSAQPVAAQAGESNSEAAVPASGTGGP